MLYAYMMLFNSIKPKQLIEMDYLNAFDHFLSSFGELCLLSKSLCQICYMCAAHSIAEIIVPYGLQ